MSPRWLFHVSVTQKLAPQHIEQASSGAPIQADTQQGVPLAFLLKGTVQQNLATRSAIRSTDLSTLWQGVQAWPEHARRSVE